MRKTYLFTLFIVALSLACCAISFNRIIYPVKTKDASGYVMNQTMQPERIACSSPAAAEILYQLNLSERIVGLTRKCDYPEEAKKVPGIGGNRIEADKLLRLKPDLTIVSLPDIKPQELEELRKLRFLKTVTFETWTGEISTEVREVSMEVFAIDPKSLEDIRNTISTIGTITNREHAAYSLNQKLGRKIDWASARAKKSKEFGKLSALVLVSRRPLTFAARGSYLNDIIGSLGLIDAAGDRGGLAVKMTRNEIEKADPDLIITSTDVARNPKDIYNSRDFRKTSAGRNKKVICIDKEIFRRPGPRIGNVIEQIGEFAYGWSENNGQNEQ